MYTFSDLLPQLLSHVHAYAEMLHSWKLIQKRTEMYKAIKTVDPYLSSPISQNGLGKLTILKTVNFCQQNRYFFDQIGFDAICQRCGGVLVKRKCLVCTNISQPFPFCVICRIPVKGLFFNSLSISNK